MTKEQTVEDMVRVLYGLPPYNTFTNVCYGDAFYRQSIINKFGQKLFDDTCKKLGVL